MKPIIINLNIEKLRKKKVNMDKSKRMDKLPPIILK